MTWRSRAACLGVPEVMFDGTRQREAIALCRRCSVLNDCLEWALTQPALLRISDGVIAGTTTHKLYNRWRNERHRGVA